MKPTNAASPHRDVESAARRTAGARIVDRVLIATSGIAILFALTEFAALITPLRVKYGTDVFWFAGALVAGALLTLVAWLRDDVEPPPVSSSARAFFTCSILIAVPAIQIAPTSTRLGALVLAGLIGAVFGALRAVQPWRERVVEKRLARAAGFVAFQLCLLFVLAEIGLRVVARVSTSPLFRRIDQSVSANVARSRYPTGFPRFGFPANSLGFIDHEIAERRAGDRRVLVIGDSFVVGVVPHYFHFTTVCEREIEIDVVAAGVPGIGPYEYLHILATDGPQIEADEIVISVFVGNDLYEAEFSRRPVHAWSNWLDRKSLFALEVPRRLWILRTESAASERAAVDFESTERLDPSVLSNPTALEECFPWLADYRLEVDGHSEEAFIAIETDRLTANCRTHAAAPEAIFDALERIHREAGDTRITVLALPDELQVDDVLYETVTHRLKHEAFERDRPQRQLAEFCAARGIPFLDVLPALRAATPEADGRPHVYHRYDTHLNRKGNEIVGKELARFLEASRSAK